jgi:hypothetical protein
MSIVARFLVLDLHLRRRLSVLPLPIRGEGGGEGVTGSTGETLTPHPTALPSELGQARVRHFRLTEVGYIRLRLGEGADRIRRSTVLE